MYRSYALGSQPRWLSKYISSLNFDIEICPYVIDILKVHIIQLSKLGKLKKEDVNDLYNLLDQFDCNNIDGYYEDIHEAIEYFLISRNEKAKWINLGKSRNDQVATAIRMRMKEDIIESIKVLRDLVLTLVSRALPHLDTPFPTFTHLQPAQPTTFGHYLLSFAEEVLDLIELLITTYEVTDKCPMGSAAAAGSTVPLDRAEYCKMLCFRDIALNTLYATSTRSFILSYLSSLIILSIPILRFIEDMFFLCTPLIGIIIVPNDHAGTSSIMPHKRNPSTLEVARAELSKLLGSFSASYALLKGLPSGYVLDYQQLTPLVWESGKTFRLAVTVVTDFIDKVEINYEAIQKTFKYPLLAADVAEYLSMVKDIPFRDAYAIVAKVTKDTYNMREIAEKVLGDEAEEVLRDPISRRKGLGAPGNPYPIIDKIKRSLSKLNLFLEEALKDIDCDPLDAFNS